MKKLAIITTHPIQYNAPLFQVLAKRKRISIKVFYTWGESVLQNKYDPGFGETVTWDIPLMDGYEYRFVENVAKNPGSHHFKGIENPGLIAEILNWKADAILLLGWNFKSHLSLIRRIYMKIPIFFRGDSTLLDETNFSSIGKIHRKYFLKWLYKHVDHAFYVGSSNKKYFQRAGLKESQLSWAPHAIDNSRFAFDLEGRISYRKQLGIPHDALTFLFAGKLEPKKDVKTLLKAFSKIEKANSHLIIAGSGQLEGTLKFEYSKVKNVHFIPFQNQTQMPKLYSASDIFVLPSKGPGETWGLSINEAMANGRVVIASDKCGCANDLVKNNINGFVFKAGNSIDLFNKLNLLEQSSKEQIAEMGKASEKYIAVWSFETLAESIENKLLSI